jgi:hypothetical protein
MSSVITSWGVVTPEPLDHRADHQARPHHGAQKSTSTGTDVRNDDPRQEGAADGGAWHADRLRTDRLMLPQFGQVTIVAATVPDIGRAAAPVKRR